MWSDRPPCIGVVFAQEFQRAVGEHHTETERGIGSVLLDEPDLDAGPAALKQVAEIEPGRPGPEYRDAHGCPLWIPSREIISKHISFELCPLPIGRKRVFGFAVTAALARLRRSWNRVVAGASGLIHPANQLSQGTFLSKRSDDLVMSQHPSDVSPPSGRGRSGAFPRRPSNRRSP